MAAMCCSTGAIPLLSNFPGGRLNSTRPLEPFGDQDRIAIGATGSDHGGLRHHGGGELRHPEVGDLPTGGGK